MGKHKGTLSVDKTEFILIDTHGPGGQMNITQDQVAGFTLERVEIRKLFRKISTEKITIDIRKVHPSPYILESECGENWPQYKGDLQKFAVYNSIPFTNKL